MTVKATELVKTLQGIISTYGDLPVYLDHKDYALGAEYNQTLIGTAASNQQPLKAGEKYILLDYTK